MTVAAAVAAFYGRVPVGHVEAGLRTWRKDAPFPEEVNRQLTTIVTDWHFAATAWARDNLQREGVPGERVWLTGNPVVDALKWAVAHLGPRRGPGFRGRLGARGRRSGCRLLPRGW